ncbi:polysaccharide deacetylase family protein [Streptomyces sp. ISL-99]|uniref:polysaccharide deacetylase family protein n=1 Tax=Streptomyces sp. ISL-99 TaxID=2819193 RepID=UPI001BE74A76|nr:polysaccharide deacetylase family protein [Streptomyces sp. ISL-99]MBT2524612.1 polysaccharide deacetylase family protein [Streptomyces sp. ISL-99]
MQLVRQKEETRRKSRRQVRMVLAVLLASAIGSGCAGGPADTPEQGGQPAPAAGQQQEYRPGADQDLAGYAERLRRAQALRAAAAKKWGLARPPLAAPPPPAVKPKITTRKGFSAGPGLPPVFTTVPVKERVVFLTMDDGAEKDPELLRMMTELGIPYSAFLSDYLVRENYGYFERMQGRGVALHNHTLNHRYMPGLSYKQQRREICGMQDVIEQRYGKRPRLFRPPYGNYNADTLRAARSCGIEAVPLWAAEAFPDRMEWREWDRDLHPGDIILTHFRGKEDWKGTMPDMIRRVMKTVTAKGYAVARLEDYL